jgi:hypothetical protein
MDAAAATAARTMSHFKPQEIANTLWCGGSSHTLDRLLRIASMYCLPRMSLLDHDVSREFLLRSAPCPESFEPAVAWQGLRNLGSRPWSDPFGRCSQSNGRQHRAFQAAGEQHLRV